MTKTQNFRKESVKRGALIISPSCANNCVFCPGKKKSAEQEIQKQEETMFKNIINFQENKIDYIEISGADPIEYARIIPLIKYLKKLNFSVQLSTHGNRLGNNDFLKKFITSGVDRIRIPIYGPNSGTHDRVTQTKGSFKSTLLGLKQIIKKTSIHAQISSLIVQQNKNDLKEILDLVLSLGVDDFYIAAPCVKDGNDSFYVPYKDMGTYLRDVREYAVSKNFKLKFMEIPYCVFGEYDPLMDNSLMPPSLGKHFPLPSRDRGEAENIPRYRRKKKARLCDRCICFDFCSGFLVSDIDTYGTGGLKPLSRVTGIA